MKFNYDKLVAILGAENDAAIETLFDANEWDYEEGVTMEAFLPEWTALVEQGTAMMIAEKCGLSLVEVLAK